MLRAFGAALIAAAATSAIQEPHPALVEWERYCLQTGGDPEKAIAAAEADGWKADDVSQEPGSTTANRVILKSDGQHNLLVIRETRQKPGHAPAQVTVCIVSVPAWHGDPVAAMTERFGQPGQGPDGHMKWLFVRADGSLKPTPTTSDAIAQALKSRSRISAEGHVDDHSAAISLVISEEPLQGSPRKRASGR
jgi:hypothetical protein